VIIKRRHRDGISKSHAVLGEEIGEGCSVVLFAGVTEGFDHAMARAAYCTRQISCCFSARSEAAALRCAPAKAPHRGCWAGKIFLDIVAGRFSFWWPPARFSQRACTQTALQETLGKNDPRLTGAGARSFSIALMASLASLMGCLVPRRQL
jgi:hypothetical protein